VIDSNKNFSAERLGGAMWLYMKSPAYQALTVAELRDRLVAPIRFDQCRIYWARRLPFAWISFALVTPEVEARILNEECPVIGKSPALEIHEWNRGDRLWIIDFLAPFGGASAVIANLRRHWWLPQSAATSLRPTAHGRRISRWTPMARDGKS